MALMDTIRKVPTWGWLVVGGATLGVGYSAYRDRKTPDALAPPAGEGDLAAGDGLSQGDYFYGGSQPAPIGIVSPPAPYDNAGEVGSIGQTAFETLVEAVTGVVDTVPALIEAARPDPVPITISLPQAPAPAASPTPIRTTAPGPVATAPTSVTILGKRFVGAYRYAEIPTPKLASRDFNVFFPKPHHDERWRTWYSNGSRHWNKIAEGNWDAR